MAKKNQLMHGQKVQRGMMRTKRGILSPAAELRRDRVSKGLCGGAGDGARVAGSINVLLALKFLI